MTSINLTKDNAGLGNGATLTDVTRLNFGASWDASTRGQSGFMGKMSRKGGLDIDLIGVLMQGTKAVKFAGLDNLDPLKNGAFTHSGDNQTGHGEGDDEVIIADLPRIPLAYTSIILTASVFKGGKSGLFGSMASASRDKGFQGANNVEFRVYNASLPGAPIEDALIMPDLAGTQNACLIAKLSRTSLADANAPWQIEIMEEMVNIVQDDINSLLNACRNR